MGRLSTMVSIVGVKGLSPWTKLTHLLVGSTVCPNNGRRACHVDAALVVVEVYIAELRLVRGDEAIEEAVGVLLFASELVQTALVGGGGGLSCRCASHELSCQERCVLLGCLG